MNNDKHRDFRAILEERVLFFDGGMGTQLQAAGLSAGEASEMWSLSHPDALIKIHLAYLNAGANILCANTFGVNGLKYPDGGDVTADALVRAAITAAKEAIARFEAEPDKSPYAKEPHFVALDIGPTGRLMAPLGDLTVEKAIAAFSASVKAAAEAGADLVAVETMNDIAEAKAAVLAAKEIAPELPVISTVVFSEQGRMLTGTGADAAAVILSALGVDAMGLNCSLGPDKMKKIVPGLVKAAAVPVSVSPNAGLPVTENGVTSYPCGAEEFARQMTEVLSAGARILGGCCGTTPEHIRVMRKTLSPDALCAPLTPMPEAHLLAGRMNTVDPTEEDIVIYPLTPENEDVREALDDEDYESIGSAALDAADEDAEILFLSMIAEDVNEVDALPMALDAVQEVCPMPVILYAKDPAALESALRICGSCAGICPHADMPTEVYTALAGKYGAVICTPDDVPALKNLI